MPFAITSFLPFYLLASRLEIESGSCTASFIFHFAFGFVLPDLPGVFIVVPLWAVTIIHGFKVRPLYLIQLDVYKDHVEARAFAEARSEAESRFHAPKQSIQDIHIRKEQ